jgi:hypothetical protein
MSIRPRKKGKGYEVLGKSAYYEAKLLTSVTDLISKNR